MAVQYLRPQGPYYLTIGAAFTATLAEAASEDGAVTATLYDLDGYGAVGGLMWDAAGRTLSGTPTRAGAYTLTYRVKAADTPAHAWDAQVSIALEVAPAAPTIPAPTGLAASSRTPSGFAVAWAWAPGDLTDAQAQAVQFNLEHRLAGSRHWQKTWLSAHVLGHTLSGLAENSLYYVRVRAEWGGLKSAWAAGATSTQAKGQSDGTPFSISYQENSIRRLIYNATAGAVAAGTTAPTATQLRNPIEFIGQALVAQHPELFEFVAAIPSYTAATGQPRWGLKLKRAITQFTGTLSFLYYWTPGNPIYTGARWDVVRNGAVVESLSIYNWTTEDTNQRPSHSFSSTQALSKGDYLIFYAWFYTGWDSGTVQNPLNPGYNYPRRNTNIGLWIQMAGRSGGSLFSRTARTTTPALGTEVDTYFETGQAPHSQDKGMGKLLQFALTQTRGVTLAAQSNSFFRMAIYAGQGAALGATPLAVLEKTTGAAALKKTLGRGSYTAEIFADATEENIALTYTLSTAGALTTPTPVRSLAVVVRSATHSRVSWLAPSDGNTPTKYELRYKKLSESTWSATQSTGTNRHWDTPTTLTADTVYQTQVRAVAGSLTGPWSNNVYWVRGQHYVHPLPQSAQPDRATGLAPVQPVPDDIAFAFPALAQDALKVIDYTSAQTTAAAARGATTLRYTGSGLAVNDIIQVGLYNHEYQITAKTATQLTLDRGLVAAVAQNAAIVHRGRLRAPSAASGGHYEWVLPLRLDLPAAAAQGVANLRYQKKITLADADEVLYESTDGDRVVVFDYARVAVQGRSLLSTLYAEVRAVGEVAGQTVGPPARSAALQRSTARIPAVAGLPAVPAPENLTLELAGDIGFGQHFAEADRAGATFPLRFYWDPITVPDASTILYEVEVGFETHATPTVDFTMTQNTAIASPISGYSNLLTQALATASGGLLEYVANPPPSSGVFPPGVGAARPTVDLQNITVTATNGSPATSLPTLPYPLEVAYVYDDGNSGKNIGYAEGQQTGTFEHVDISTNDWVLVGLPKANATAYTYTVRFQGTRAEGEHLVRLERDRPYGEQVFYADASRSGATWAFDQPAIHRANDRVTAVLYVTAWAWANNKLNRSPRQKTTLAIDFPANRQPTP